MCDKSNHSHGLIETWVTPIDSQRLRAKLVQLEPGQSMPAHSTGPGREEVITCIFGSVIVTIGTTTHTLTAGEACYIPENTQHSVNNMESDHALYCFVVSVPTFHNSVNGFKFDPTPEDEIREKTFATRF